ncbi:MAG: universal stress protein [Gammaproteobacteria bacterium]|nr:MAG: universal stress protein [Gammaproteobacteria bacterium]
MANYKNILVAVDYTEEAHKVLAKAKAMAAGTGAKITLLHVVETVPVVGGPESFSYVDLYVDQPDVIDRALSDMKTLAAAIGVNIDNFLVLTGVPKHEITSCADEQGVDLIVLGSHGRHGIRLILGSTAAGVLHHAKCDVLAVRV